MSDDEQQSDGRKKHIRGNPGQAIRAEDPAGLSERERLFVEAYFDGWPNRRTLAELAQIAGSPSKSPGSLRVQGYRMRHAPAVVAEIARIKRELAEDANLTADELLVRMQQISAEASRSQQYAPAIRALELVGKELHGQFTDKLDLRVESGVQNLLEAARSFMKHPETWHDVVQAIAQAAGVAGVDPETALPVGAGASGGDGADAGAAGGDGTRH